MTQAERTKIFRKTTPFTLKFTKTAPKRLDTILQISFLNSASFLTRGMIPNMTEAGRTKIFRKTTLFTLKLTKTAPKR